MNFYLLKKVVVFPKLKLLGLTCKEKKSGKKLKKKISNLLKKLNLVCFQNTNF